MKYLIKLTVSIIQKDTLRNDSCFISWLNYLLVELSLG